MNQRDKRLAVVIGNADYQTGDFLPIPNAVKDAEAVEATLESLGFEVVLRVNQERNQIFGCFEEIRNRWKNEANEIVIYYSGHGTSIDGEMYLCPVDATVKEDFTHQIFLDVEEILKFLLRYRSDERHPVIVILDCCRSIIKTNNTHGNAQDPLRGIRGRNNGKTNIAILYSTTEGHVALEGNSNDGHSPYTQLLLENIVKDYTIDQIHSTIARSLSNSGQVPWIYHSLHESYKFYLTKPIAFSPEFTVAAENDLVKKPFYGVPHKNNDFINRPKILANIETFLEEDSNEGNIVALCGLDGMGKTQLMLHYCFLRRTTYKLIFWLEIGDLVTTLDSFLKLAINLKLDEEIAKEKCKNDEIIEWVCSWLEERKGWLLLLNNFDNTMAAKLFEVLPRIGGNIILTTREHISSNNAKIISVGNMNEDEALSLLLGTAEMNSINRGSSRYLNAKNIVEELDFVPLAIYLARAYVESVMVSFEDYLNILKNKREIFFRFEDKGNIHRGCHSLRTVWQCSFECIRKQSPMAAKLLETCAFLHSEKIPMSLFQRQYSFLELTSHTLSSTVPKADMEGPEAIQEAVNVLKKFSFVTLTLNEDKIKTDPAYYVLTIHRLVHQAVYNAIDKNQSVPYIYNLARALKKEIDFSDSHSSLTRTMMNAYISHIRHFARCARKNNNALLSEDLFNLMIQTTSYLLDNGVYFYFDVEELAKLALSVSKFIHKPESQFMAESITCLASVYNYQGNYAKAEPLYKQALEIREKVLGHEHLDTAASWNNLASLYFNQKNYVKAEPLFERALAVRKMALGPNHPDTMSSLSNLLALYLNQGNYGNVQQSYEKILIITKKILGPEHKYTACSLNNLALLYFHQGNYAKAKPLYEQALEIREKVLGPEHPDTASSLNYLALFYDNQGNYTKAEELCKRAVEIRERALKAEHPDTATSLNNLAKIYFNMKNYDKAFVLCERALNIRENVLGPDHQDIASSLDNLALLYRHQGEYNKVEQLYKRAMNIREEKLGLEHPDTASSMNNLGLLFDEQRNYNKAKPLYEQALKIRENVLGPEHPDTADSLNNLAVLCFNQREYEEAKPLYQRALVIREKAFGPEHLETANSLHNLALLYEYKGDYNEAESHYERALKVYQKVLGPEHPYIASSLHNLALLFSKKKDYVKAEQRFEQALAIREKTLGPEHSDTISSLNKLLSLYFNQGNYDKAGPYCQRARSILEKALKSAHLETAASLNNLAETLGDFAKAESLYKKELATKEKTLGPEHPDTVNTLDDLALLYFNQKNYKKAEELYERALEIREKKFGPEHPDTVRSIKNLTLLYKDQKNYEKARTCYERVQTIRQNQNSRRHETEKKSGSEHPSLISARQDLPQLNNHIVSPQGNVTTSWKHKFSTLFKKIKKA